MSQRERDELEWLKRAKDGSITQRAAAQRIGVSDRWVRKLLKRMSKQGDSVVLHGLRGREAQASRENTTTGADDSETAGMARFWADLCCPTAGPASSDPGGKRDPAWMDALFRHPTYLPA
ncbi:MAG: helix-turn-helix domain-containing protein [Acidobacteriota bacterium]